MNQLASHGFNLTEIKTDGKLHRFDRNGKKNAWYVCHEITPGKKIVIYGDWKTGEKYEYFEKKLTEIEKKQVIKQVESNEEVKNFLQDVAAINAEKIFSMATNYGESLYLKRKLINDLYGTKLVISQTGMAVAVPIKDIDDKLWGIQFIYPDGQKMFLSNQKMQGCFHQIGQIENHDIVICEGFSTGATIHQITKLPVVCAMNVGNLLSVGKEIRKKYPKHKIIIAADNDQYSTSGLNIGKEKGQEAALQINAKFVMPIFLNKETQPTDFNDLFVLYQDANLILDYFIQEHVSLSPDLLNKSLSQYILEGQRMINCPLEYVAYMTIAALSAAIGPKFRGKPMANNSYAPPTTIWTMGIGDKGTAKTSAIEYSFKWLYQIERELMTHYAKEIKDKKNLLIALDKKLKTAQTALGKIEPDTEEFKTKLKEISDLETEFKKISPQKYNFLINDMTTASAIDMLQNAPNGLLIVNDELSYLFQMFNTEHGSSLRQLALIGWNGSGLFQKKLKGEENFTILKDFSFNMIGMVQPSVLQKFLKKDQVDDGFIERFQLIFWPEKSKPKRRTNFVLNEKIQFKIQDMTKNFFSARYMAGLGKPDTNYYTVPYSDEAEQKYLDYDLEFQNMASVDSNMAGFYAKCSRTLISLSTIFYCIEKYENPKMEPEVKINHVEEAFSFIKFSFNYACKLYNNLI